jgi:antitoxin component YwqK of YwqJK toxin-antitoxin module
MIVLVSCNKKEYYYCKTGELESVIEHIDDSIVRVKYYHKNGNLLEEGCWLDNKNIKDERIGLWKLYSDDGKLEWENNYDNEHKLCYSKFYFPNGKVGLEGYHSVQQNKEDFRIGHWKEYFSDGELQWEGEYIDGKIQWREIDYEEALKLKVNVDIKYDKKIQIGDTVKYRVIIPSVHYSQYSAIIVGDHNYECKVNTKSDKDLYPGILIRKDTGILCFTLFFNDSTGKFNTKVGQKLRCLEYDIPEK